MWQVLVYEADEDACGLGTEFLEDTFRPLFDSLLPRTSRWRPWGLGSGDPVVGGYAMQWGHCGFASIRGAGHLAPLDRPAAAYTLISAFTARAPLPPATR